jgi:gas vesicle protein
MIPRYNIMRTLNTGLHSRGGYNMRTSNFLLGAIIGSIIGAGIAMITAPASGDELREQMRDRAERLQIEVKNAAAIRRAEMEQQLAAMRAPRSK